jgi:hypothetical protein
MRFPGKHFSRVSTRLGVQNVEKCFPGKRIRKGSSDLPQSSFGDHKTLQISRRQLIPIFDKPAFSRFSQLFQPRIVVHIFGKNREKAGLSKMGMSSVTNTKASSMNQPRATHRSVGIK